MNKLLSFALLVLSLFAVSCGTSYWHYKQPTDTAHIQHGKVIPVYLDSRFSEERAKELMAAFNEWNYVLNGQITIQVERTTFSNLGEAKAQFVEYLKTGLGWVVLNLNEDDPIIENMLGDPEGVLAYVTRLDGHLMVVIDDHLGSRDLKTIAMHEVGHLLGAQHVNAPSLMYPYFSERQYACIDKITVAQIATFNKMDLDTLRYCVTPGFE